MATRSGDGVEPDLTLEALARESENLGITTTDGMDEGRAAPYADRELEGEGIDADAAGAE